MLPGSWRLRNELGVESLFKESYCSRKISPLSGSEHDSDSTRKTLSWEWVGRTSGNCWRGRRGVVVGGSSGGGICNLMLQPAGLHTTLADVSCFGHAVLWWTIVSSTLISQRMMGSWEKLYLSGQLQRHDRQVGYSVQSLRLTVLRGSSDIESGILCLATCNLTNFSKIPIHIQS